MRYSPAAVGLPNHLLELVRAEAPQTQLADEGFSEWEVRAARAIVSRERQHSSAQGALSADARARVLTDTG